MEGNYKNVINWITIHKRNTSWIHYSMSVNLARMVCITFCAIWLSCGYTWENFSDMHMFNEDYINSRLSHENKSRSRNGKIHCWLLCRHVFHRHEEAVESCFIWPVNKKPSIFFKYIFVFSSSVTFLGLHYVKDRRSSGILCLGQWTFVTSRKHFTNSIIQF